MSFKYFSPELHERIKALPTEKSNRGDRQLQVEQLQPRVVNKLTLCFYPMTTIMPLVTEMTGLDNYNLTGQAQFDSGAVELLQRFLARLEGPVCLVAHNGDKYDFPLLQAELAKCQAGLSEEILCVDSYLGCRKIYSDRCKQEIVNQELQALSDLLEQGAFEEEFEEVFEEQEAAAKKRKTEVRTQLGSSSSRLEQNGLITASENDTTPARKKTESLTLINTPKVKSPKTKQPPITSVFKPRKRLLFSEDKKTVPSFSLGSLHTRLVGLAPAQAHGAEADCLALLRMTSALGQDWLEFVQSHHQPLANIKPMWSWKI